MKMGARHVDPGPPVAHVCLRKFQKQIEPATIHALFFNKHQRGAFSVCALYRPLFIHSTFSAARQFPPKHGIKVRAQLWGEHAGQAGRESVWLWGDGGGYNLNQGQFRAISVQARWEIAGCVWTDFLSSHNTGQRVIALKEETSLTVALPTDKPLRDIFCSRAKENVLYTQGQGINKK